MVSEVGPQVPGHAQPAPEGAHRRRALLAYGADGDYDAFIIDAYRQPYIPFHLVTKEFFESSATT